MTDKSTQTLAQLFLQLGLDLHAPTFNLAELLRWAAANRHEKAVAVLLRHGASINEFGSRGYNPLLAATNAGHRGTAQLLLEARADANVQHESHGSALHLASKNSEFELARLLMRHQADINAHGGPYGSALQAAAHAGHYDIVKLLLNHGANIDAEGGLYHTALQAAAEADCREIVHYLLDNGANLHAEGGLYGTALQAASHPEMIQLLLNRYPEFPFN